MVTEEQLRKAMEELLDTAPKAALDNLELEAQELLIRYSTQVGKELMKLDDEIRLMTVVFQCMCLAYGLARKLEKEGSWLS